jgi:hypothetical protein
LKERKSKPTLQERIQTYLDATPPAIAYSDGHKQTFKVACLLFNGWALTIDETLAWLKVYNTKCEPPWSDKELAHKAKDAAKAKHENRAAISLLRQSQTNVSNRIGACQPSPAPAVKYPLR